MERFPLVSVGLDQSLGVSASLDTEGCLFSILERVETPPSLDQQTCAGGACSGALKIAA